MGNSMADSIADSSSRGRTGNIKFANFCAIAMLLFIGSISVIQLTEQEAPVSAVLTAVISSLTALALILLMLNAMYNPVYLAFLVPMILFLTFTIQMILCAWNVHYYLHICLCFCGISCIYTSFKTSIWYMLFQNAVICVLVFTGFPVIGPDVPAEIYFSTTIVTWLINLFGMLILFLLNWSATVVLGFAAKDQKSLKSILETSLSYVCIIDFDNKVIQLSTPLAQLAQIQKPEFGKGRPFLDLFPGPELKLLAYKMLKQKGSYEGYWEFTLNGTRRYFKVVSIGIAESRGETLVTLHDLTHLAERNEIALMRDSLKIGLFFMNDKYIIQDHYSRFLEELLNEKNLHGKNFLDILSGSFKAKELDAVRDYFDMVFNKAFDQNILIDINPLNEIVYISAAKKRTFHVDLSRIEQGSGEAYILVTVYDISANVELQRRLLEEENRRQESMKTIFELIQVDPAEFGDFMADAEYEFGRISETLNRDSKTDDVLLEIFQSVHAVKSNAVILGLNSFGSKVHALETKIKKLRFQEEPVSTVEINSLAMDLEELSREKNSFKLTLDKIQSITRQSGVSAGRRSQAEHLFIESLVKTTYKTAQDLEKNVQFSAEEIDAEAIENGPRRVMKEVLMQLIRNSVAHGIEPPEERIAAGKAETGTISLSIKIEESKIHLTLNDDGYGLDYKKIREKALRQNLLNEENLYNKDLLTELIFSPGFSTFGGEDLHGGRGIGLNLVQERVNEARGTISVKTEEGKFTRFDLFFPNDRRKSTQDINDGVTDFSFFGD